MSEGILRRAWCPWCVTPQEWGRESRECPGCHRRVRVAFFPNAGVQVLKSVPASTPNPWPEVAIGPS